MSSRKSRHNCILSVFLVHKLNPWFCTHPKFGVLRDFQILKQLMCKRLLSVSDKTRNHMVYGETGSYPLYIELLFLALDAGLNLIRCP